MKGIALDIADDDSDHAEALAETGFWGRRGAGCLVHARSTGRYLVALRSQDVLEPGTWGTWGGAVPNGADPVESVLRELDEETGFRGQADMVHVWRYSDGASGFTYDTYVAIVEDEFEPVLNWESDGFAWVEEGEWPEPLHYGLREVLEKAGRMPRTPAAPR